MVSYFLAKNATNIMRETISSWGRALDIIWKRMVRVHYCCSFNFWRVVRYHYEKHLRMTDSHWFKNRAIGGEQL